MSAVYGSDALGGIINIITKKPRKFFFKSQAQYGQFNNDGQNGNLSFHLMSGGHEMGTWGVSLSGQIFDAEPYIQENGDTPRPDRNLKTGALKLTYDFDRVTTLTFDASVMDEEEESIITSTMGHLKFRIKFMMTITGMTYHWGFLTGSREQMLFSRSIHLFTTNIVKLDTIKTPC